VKAFVVSVCLTGVLCFASNRKLYFYAALPRAALSVAPHRSVRPSVCLSVACLRFSLIREAIEAYNLVKTALAGQQ